ncbi:hypothetical protein [Lysinibacter sp. HNR]|uniref:leucine-rich repeat domain-containing protein n=1 Tax=Lysinibacter sp. HNR TaxID=3031408 RepID=UPI0024359CF3|nr:hypothetical protein [Lysinibacter sp. HNR]WGD37284.1 hypothetical protein FrondiHNR_12785 [Lysinibacter sp. HNR]
MGIASGATDAAFRSAVETRNDTLDGLRDLREQPLVPASVSRAVDNPDRVIEGIDSVLSYLVNQLLSRDVSTPITVGDMAQLQYFSVGYDDSPAPQRIAGMEYAVNLRVFELGPLSEVSDISPLSGLSQLASVKIETSTVRDISALTTLPELLFLTLTSDGFDNPEQLAELTVLRSLTLNNLRLNNYDFLADLTQVTYLDLNNSTITDLAPLSPLTQLEHLSLSGTAFQSADPLATLISLTDLNLGAAGNTDGTLGFVSGMDSLVALVLEGAGVEDISALSDKAQLSQIWLAHNSIADLSPLNNVSSLSLVDLSSNLIVDVGPLTQSPYLMVMNLSNNSITDVGPLAGFLYPYDINLDANQITDLSSIVFNEWVNLSVRDQNVHGGAFSLPEGATTFNGAPGYTITGVGSEEILLVASGGSSANANESLFWNDVTAQTTELTASFSSSNGMFTGLVTYPVIWTIASALNHQ